jgi:hypothetical protein
LGDLAGVGLSSLAYLESRTAPPAGWQAQQMSILDAAAQPSALVRFTMLYSMRKLVLAAGTDGTDTRALGRWNRVVTPGDRVGAEAN